MIHKTSKILFLALSLLLISNSSFAQKKSKKTKTTSGISEENKVKSERFFFDGEKEKIKENYFEALRNFEQALKLNPNIDAAWYEIAIINTRQKDYKSALANAEKALKISPKNIWYRAFYGEMLSANASFDKASDVFNKLKADYPNNTEFYYNEAFLLIKQNKPKDAIKVYNELEKQIGVQEDISNEKYKLYLDQSNAAGAENELLKLLETEPTSLVYLNKLAQFYQYNKQEEKAVSTYNKILEIEPENTLALISLADYYKSKGNEEQYKYYSKKAFSNPKLDIDAKISILYNYITLYQQKKIPNLNDAFEYAEILKTTHANEAKSWAISGDLYYLAEKNEQALQDYKKSLTLQQDVFTVWQQVFFIESDEKKYDDLVKDTEAAKEFFPNQAMVYFFNGLANQQLKENEKAIKAYETGVKMAISLPLLQAQFYSNLGESYNNLKNYEKSDANFDKSLALDPNNQYVLNNYSYYLSIREEKLDQAKQMSAKSLELSPDNPTYLDTFAWILYKSKNYKDALKIQEKAIKLSKTPSAEMYEHLGDMYYQLNQKDDAKQSWEKAKTAGGNIESLNKKLASWL